MAGLALVLLGAAHAGLFVAGQAFLRWAVANGFPPWFNLAWRVGGVTLGLLEAVTLAVVIWAVLAGHGPAAAADEDE